MSANVLICTMEQRTPEWFAARAGRVTGSVAKSVLMGKTTGGRKKLIRTLALERITGTVIEDDFYISHAMQRGIDMEPKCRMFTEDHRGVMIRETGFLQHKELMIGSSLDGDTEDLKVIYEMKCPNRETHIGYLDEGVIPEEYMPQVLHNLYVSGAEEIVFSSFDDRLPAGLDFFCVSFKAADLDIAGYEKKLMEFLKEVDELEVRLRARQPSDALSF